VGRREEAKQERRDRIVAAARDLIRQVGVDGISMKGVATRAHVSQSTIYNLFESKEHVLSRVFNDAFGQYLAAVAERASPEPLQRFFDAVDIAAEFYSADAPFYRSSVWLVDADSDYKLALQKPRFGFFRDLVSQAIEGGVLGRETDAYVLGLMVVPMFSAPYQAWAGGWLSIEEFQARAKLGISIVLKGFAAPGQRARFDTLLPAFEAQVVRLRMGPSPVQRAARKTSG
jgi:AcrR family transcriptional regulator